MTEQNETKKYTWLEIRKQGIEVHFQPIYNIADRRIAALEALFRACDGNGGYLNSEQVVQDIEAEGHSYALDCWVIDQTCKALRQGFGNLIALFLFYNANFCDKIEKEIKE